MERTLDYKFELPKGKYKVELYFTDPWGCSKNPTVSLEGQEVLTNVEMNRAVTAEVLVEDGELDLSVTTPSETLCINLCYIKIYLPKDAAATPTPEPTATPTPEATATPTPNPTEAPVDPTEVPDNHADTADTNQSANSNNDGSSLPWIAVGVVVLVAIAGALTYFYRKKKK